MGHVLALAIWIFGLGNLFFGYPGAWGIIASCVLGILIVAETLFVPKRFRQSPDPKPEPKVITYELNVRDL